MYPDREMLRRWSFCHRQPSCWSRMLEPIVNVFTTEFAPTSQTLEVLSPEAESKWVLSGLQLICANETRVTRWPVSVGRGLRQQPSPAPTSERGEAGRRWARLRRVSRGRQATSPASHDPEALSHRACFRASNCGTRSDDCEHPQDPATAPGKPEAILTA